MTRTAVVLLAGATALTLAVVVAPADGRAPTVFGSPTPITSTGDWPPGTATPYPSSIEVTGMTDPVTSVTVTLHAFDLPHPEDTDILLVGPTGVAVMLMSDVSRSEVTHPIELSFAADGQAFPTAPGVTPIESGTYLPKDEAALPGTDGGEPPAPAPSGYTSDLTSLDGVDPNGTWSLFVYQDTDTTPNRSIGGGWSLTFNGAVGCRLPARAPGRAECQLLQQVHYRFEASSFPDKVVDVRKPDVIGVQAAGKGRTAETPDLRVPVRWRGTVALQVETTGRDDTTVLSLTGKASVRADEDEVHVRGPAIVNRSNLRSCADGSKAEVVVTDKTGDSLDTVGIAYCGRILTWRQKPDDAFTVRSAVVTSVPG